MRHDSASGCGDGATSGSLSASLSQRGAWKAVFSLVAEFIEAVIFQTVGEECQQPEPGLDTDYGDHKIVGALLRLPPTC